MQTLKDKILHDIQEERIIPRPRWQFILLHILVWGFCVITLIAGIVAVSFVFLEMHMPERMYMDWLSDRPVLFLRLLPFIWGVGALIALVLGSLLFSKTDRGYRFPLVTMLVVLVFGSLLGGWILYATHVPHFGERQMQRFMGGYGDMRVRIRGEAPKPEDGHLLVRITRKDLMVWTGQDMGGREWEVALTCSDAECEKNASEITIGGYPILFIGEISGESSFEATSLRLPPRNADERKKLREDFSRDRTGSGPRLLPMNP